eukprot:gene5650-biopygen10058
MRERLFSNDPRARFARRGAQRAAAAPPDPTRGSGRSNVNGNPRSNGLTKDPIPFPTLQESPAEEILEPHTSARRLCVNARSLRAERAEAAVPRRRPAAPVFGAAVGARKANRTRTMSDSQDETNSDDARRPRRNELGR